MEKSQNLSRRTFLFQSGKSLALLTAANVGVYTIGSAFKKLDGNLVAGAKMCSCLCEEIPGQCGSTPPTSMLRDCMGSHPTDCSLLNGSCVGQEVKFGCGI
ncbi:MAG: hypothetical protein WA160_04960 [Pseudobdellovibrio sp.]